LHREAKRLTGPEACQCWLARSQRNYIDVALQAWNRLKNLFYKAR